jgi:hypothetical protein
MRTRRITSTMGTCALAHDDVASVVVDEDADADEGAFGIRHVEGDLVGTT